MDIWQLLEDDAPQGCDAVQDLYSWSLNYGPCKGPFTLLLDLIGWSADNLDGALYDIDSAQSTLGYVELDKLAKALTQYAARPAAVTEYIETLMGAESAS